MKGQDTARVAKIGLEVHCQLTALSSKLFCPCSSDYRGAEPNALICPVCMGLPGTLPFVNARAVEFAVMVAIALNCKVSDRTLFYRKNYFYPDLPKNFQISQYDRAGGMPIARDGWLEIEQKKVRIRRLQLEEDPGKLTYEGTIERSSYSLVDYNRAGIALVEIVTEPDMTTPREAKAFLEKLRTTLESLGVSNGELEGAMRCDANVSLSGGARVEIKNISSFKEVAKGLSYEILRQQTFSKRQEERRTETRHWDERRSITIALRTKEEEQDYRYFPEPDLAPLVFEPEEVNRIRSKMPELPELLASRYVLEYKLPQHTALEIAKNKRLAGLFEECARLYDDREGLARWMAGEFKSQLEGLVKGESPTPRAEYLVGLLQLIDNASITKVQAREVLKQMLKTGKPARSIVSEKGIVAVRGKEPVEMALARIVAARPELLEQARGDKKAFNYLVGRVLAEEPKAEPRVIAKVLAAKLRKG